MCGFSPSLLLDQVSNIDSYPRDDFLDYKATLKGHQLGVVSVTINAAGTVAASSSLDSTIKLWDLDSSKQIKSIG